MASMMAGMGGDKPDMDDLDGDSDDEDLPDLEQKNHAFTFTFEKAQDFFFCLCHCCDYKKPMYSMFKHFSFVLCLSTSVPCEMAFCSSSVTIGIMILMFPFILQIKTNV